MWSECVRGRRFSHLCGGISHDFNYHRECRDRSDVIRSEALIMAQAIEVKNLTMGYHNYIVQKDISFSVKPGEIFIVMGDSGCGKSTLMRHILGLNPPIAGDITYDGKSFWGTNSQDRLDMMRHFGVLFQTGALWSSLTLAQNVSLPLEQFTTLSTSEINDIVSYKLALVGLAGFLRNSTLLNSVEACKKEPDWPEPWH